MKALTTAIYTKASGSAFSAALGGRLYKGRAPAGTVYPYAIYFVVSDTPDNTFTEKLEDVLLQFSIFSSASSSAEVEDTVLLLRALYDDCTLSITGSTFLTMQWEQTTPSIEEHTTTIGTEEIWAYHVDYSTKVQVP